MKVPVRPTPALARTHAQSTITCKMTNHRFRLLGGQSLSSTHTCTPLPAVHHGSAGIGGAVHVVSDRPDKLDQGLAAVGDAVVGPGGVVEVAQPPGRQAAALLVEIRGR